MTTREKAARATGTAFKRKSTHAHYITTGRQGQDGIPQPGTFLESLLVRYKNGLLNLPCTVEVSRLVDCCDALLEAGREVRHG